MTQVIQKILSQLEGVKMEVSIMADGKSIELNHFIKKFIGNVTKAVLDSLKGTSGVKEATFKFNSGKVDVLIDGKSLDLMMDKGFAKVIVKDTIYAMISHLKGTRRATELELKVIL